MKPINRNIGDGMYRICLVIGLLIAILATNSGLAIGEVIKIDATREVCSPVDMNISADMGKDLGVKDTQGIYYILFLSNQCNGCKTMVPCINGRKGDEKFIVIINSQGGLTDSIKKNKNLTIVINNDGKLNKKLCIDGAPEMLVIEKSTVRYHLKGGRSICQFLNK